MESNQFKKLNRLLQWNDGPIDRTFGCTAISSRYSRSQESLKKCLNDIEDEWRGSSVEKSYIVYRSNRSGLWEVRYSNIGVSDTVNVNLKEVLKFLVAGHFDAIVLCHYHPTGSTEPSETDMRTTRLVAQLCRAIDVQLYDHIIFGTGPRFSFRDAGYL